MPHRDGLRSWRPRAGEGAGRRSHPPGRACTLGCGGMPSRVACREDREMPRIDRRQHLVAALAIWMGASAAAASGSDTRQAALYAANAAALSAAMTWCEARHGELRRGSAGEECFQKARGVLGGFGL